jgi:ankyrin repeat protein
MPPSRKKQYLSNPAGRQPAAGDDGEELLAAAVKGDGVAVARLRAAGAEPNALVTGRLLRKKPDYPKGATFRATCSAARCGNLEVVRLLLDAGADPSRADGDGHTPLMLAAGNGQLEVLQLLLGRGAAVDATNTHDLTAFHYACSNNQLDCVEAMIEAGSDVGRRDCTGETGREMAERQGHAVLVERLWAAQATACPEPQPAP